MRRPFLLGVLAALLVEALVAAVVIGSGVIDVSAVNAGGPQDRILAYASTRSIARHAPSGKNPLGDDQAALKRGLQLYGSMCAACHGGPGVDPQEFAAGLHPPAPDLASPKVQAFTDGMLYQTVSGGIGSTGMPAFGPNHRPEDLWSIVAFVRHLPALTPQEKQELARQPLGELHQPGHEQAPASPAAESATGAGQRVHQVSISNFKFVPPTLEVHVGDIVEWKNTDFVAHTATADDRSFDTGRLEADQVKRIVARRPGRFPYFCRYHLAMKGTLTVD